LEIKPRQTNWNGILPELVKGRFKRKPEITVDGHIALGNMLVKSVVVSVL